MFVYVPCVNTSNVNKPELFRHEATQKFEIHTKCSVLCLTGEEVEIDLTSKKK